MYRKAEMGVGTLIIFISLLLVAAVAAGVLIQTAGSLQQQALSTGSQATGQISTNAVTIEVSATDGSDGSVNNFSMSMRLAPGSSPIQLDSSTLSLSTTNTSQSLTYAGANITSGSTTEFGVTYLQTGDDSAEGTLTRGDVILLNFISDRELSTSESARINFIPQTGTSTLVKFNMPNVVSTQRVYLYP